MNKIVCIIILLAFLCKIHGFSIFAHNDKKKSLIADISNIYVMEDCLYGEITVDAIKEIAQTISPGNSVKNSCFVTKTNVTVISDIANFPGGSGNVLIKKGPINTTDEIMNCAQVYPIIAPSHSYGFIITIKDDLSAFYNTKSSLLHEFGHGVGLGHSSHFNAVMYSRVNNNSSLNDDDVKSLYFQYCPPKFKPNQVVNLIKNKMSGAKFEVSQFDQCVNQSTPVECVVWDNRTTARQQITPNTLLSYTASTDLNSNVTWDASTLSPMEAYDDKHLMKMYINGTDDFAINGNQNDEACDKIEVRLNDLLPLLNNEKPDGSKAELTISMNEPLTLTAAAFYNDDQLALNQLSLSGDITKVKYTVTKSGMVWTKEVPAGTDNSFTQDWDFKDQNDKDVEPGEYFLTTELWAKPANGSEYLVAEKKDVKFTLSQLPYHVGFHEQYYAGKDPWLLPVGWSVIDTHPHMNKSAVEVGDAKNNAYMVVDIPLQGRNYNWVVKSSEAYSRFITAYDLFDHHVMHLIGAYISSDDRIAQINGQPQSIAEPQNEWLISRPVKIDDQSCNLFFQYYQTCKPSNPGTYTKVNVFVNDSKVWESSGNATSFVHTEYLYDIYCTNGVPDSLELNRLWQPIKIDLSAYKNQSVKIKFQYLGFRGSDAGVDQVAIAPKIMGDLIIPDIIIPPQTKKKIFVDLKSYIYGYDQMTNVSIKPSFGSNLYVCVNGTIAEIYPKNGFSGKDWIKFDVYQNGEFVSNDMNYVTVEPDPNQVVSFDLPPYFSGNEDSNICFNVADFCNNYQSLSNPLVQYLVSDSLEAQIQGSAITLKPKNNWFGSGLVKIKITDQSGNLSYQDSALIRISSVDDLPVVTIADSLYVKWHPVFGQKFYLKRCS